MKSTIKITQKSNRCYGVFLLLGALLSGGCATDGTLDKTGNLPGVGPQLSSEFGKNNAAAATSHLPRIDIAVPVFDPNLPEDSDTWEKKGIYPELRRAESNRFALKMKSALANTGAFGAVRVVPNWTTTADLYIVGKIIESNGEDVKINLIATDISGKKWFSKNFKHRVKSSFHGDIRNKGKDSYTPLFEKAAKYVVQKLKKYDAAQLAQLKRISEIRFGTSLSEETFARYLKAKNGRVILASAPADDDPMLQRIKPIRVRDQLFIDQMQTHYDDFDAKLEDSYLVWQVQSLLKVKSARTTKTKALIKGILGGLLAVAGAAAAIEGSDDASNQSTSGVIGGTAAVLVGGALVASAWQDRAEMKIHREALAELGKSLDIEIAPQLVEYENQTAQLEGDSAEQYAQWIKFLKEIYALEATPEKQL